MISEIHTKIDSLAPYSEFHEEIAKNVWLMDNHKWALHAWEKFFTEDPSQAPLPLVHADYHWDAVNSWQTEEEVREIRQIRSLSEIKEAIVSGAIQYDNFIFPEIIRKRINEVYFYCFFFGNPTHGFAPGNPEIYGARQFICRDLDQLLKGVSGRPVLFDLDIDVFNYSEIGAETDYWDDAKIDDFFRRCRHTIRDAPVVTIAISFGCSGEENDAKKLAKCVVGKILDIRS